MRRFSTGMLVVAMSVLGAAPAAAQLGTGTRGLDSQTFRPAADAYGIFTVDRAGTARQWEFGFKFYTNFVSSPLKLDLAYGRDYSIVNRPMVDWQLAFDLMAYVGLTDRLEMFLDFPLARQQLGNAFGAKAAGDLTGFYAVDPASNVAPPEAAPLDTRVGLKLRLWGDEKYGLALQALATIPFGEDTEFMGERSFTYQPKLIGSTNIGGLVLAANLGAVIRQHPEKIYDPYLLVQTDDLGQPTPRWKPVLGVGHELTAAVGASYRVNKFVAFGVELYGGIPLYEITDTVNGQDVSFERDIYADFVGGLLFYPTAELSVTLGGGGSPTRLGGNSARGDSFRVFAGISWSPEAFERLRGDRDADGIPDEQDACPDEPEDKDEYEDDDGCPDPDNDGDGIADLYDKCPSEAEDRDGFHDEDGCADSDNDADGIPDVRDKCPNEPEDLDGYQDDDGCRDDDNDGDGIPDKDDKCPNEPETYNGYEDQDGCPDQLPGEVGPQVGVPLRVGRVEFVGNTVRMRPQSYTALDNLVADIKRWPRMKLRIEGHTDDRGRPARLLQLSKDRAEAVRQYLVSKGIDPNRLISEGYGETRPLKPNKTAAGRASNRRIEFIPVEK